MKKILLLILILIVIIGCGQQTIETQPVPSSVTPPKQEVKIECCEDSHCGLNKICENNLCKEKPSAPAPTPTPQPTPTLTTDQTTTQTIQPAPECTQDSDCMSTQTCENNECKDIDCEGNCRQIINRQCVIYNCCSDSMCDDEDVTTEDECISPITTDSHCVNTLIEPENDTQEVFECTFDTDCSDGKYCLARSCSTIQEFYSEYYGCCEEGEYILEEPACEYMSTLTNNMRDCSETVCANCLIGKQQCITQFKNTEIAFINYCAECLTDSNCKQGYVCQNRVCVSS